MLRELPVGETQLAFEAMRELRTLGSRDEFVARVDGALRPAGYRLLASFDGDAAVAVAGFRRAASLAWGDFLYVDDLVTLPAHRGRGHARRLLDRVVDEARAAGCAQVHLDSGPQRHDAHRTYLRHGFDITGYHFARPAGRGAAR